MSLIHSQPPPPTRRAGLEGDALSTAQMGTTGTSLFCIGGSIIEAQESIPQLWSIFFFYKELSNACCSWHCHRKWRIILCTLWKKQAQENPNRFNSIWVSLSYFKVGFFFFFFHLCARKRESGQSLSYTPPPLFPPPLSAFICPGREMTWVTG